MAWAEDVGRSVRAQATSSRCGIQSQKANFGSIEVSNYFVILLIFVYCCQEKDFSCWSCVINGSNPRQIITDCYISTSVKESNLANEKYQTAEIKGRRHHVFNTFASNVFHPSNRVAAVRLPISKQRVHLVRMHQACTHYIHHITTWSLRCQSMFISSHVRILKLKGVDPHRLCRPLSRVGWCLSICWYGTAGLIGNKSRLTKHFNSIFTMFKMFHFKSCWH